MTTNIGPGKAAVDSVGVVVISYAQNGEDVVLSRLFSGARGGRYVDIGAGDPIVDSVTKAFYDRGWRGINVEPTPYLHAALCQDRPGDVNLAVAIDREAGTVELNVTPPEQWGWSTIDKGLANTFRERGILVETINVEAINLTQLLDTYPGPIDFLKVDVEGAEKAVLLGADWDRFRPRVIIVEATVPNSQQPSWESWEPILVRAGYRPTLFDGLNRFYAQADDEEALELLSVPMNVFDEAQPYRWVEKLRATEEARDGALVRADDLTQRVLELRVHALNAIRIARELADPWGLRLPIE
jgi:FkbM family methyltransferase